MHARGTITGLTRGTNRNHIIRAALESIALGAAYFAGLAVGFWKNKAELLNNHRENNTFLPQISPAVRATHLNS